MSDQEALTKIMRLRILTEIARYNLQRKEGMPMQFLSCKYSRSLKPLGGFPEFITALETEGLIRIEVMATGARLVFKI